MEWSRRVRCIYAVGLDIGGEVRGVGHVEVGLEEVRCYGEVAGVECGVVEEAEAAH